MMMVSMVCPNLGFYSNRLPLSNYHVLHHVERRSWGYRQNDSDTGPLQPEVNICLLHVSKGRRSACVWQCLPVVMRWLLPGIPVLLRPPDARGSFLSQTHHRASAILHPHGRRQYSQKLFSKNSLSLSKLEKPLLRLEFPHLPFALDKLIFVMPRAKRSRKDADLDGQSEWAPSKKSAQKCAAAAQPKTPKRRDTPCIGCLVGLVNWMPEDGEPKFCYDAAGMHPQLTWVVPQC